MQAQQPLRCSRATPAAAAAPHAAVAAAHHRRRPRCCARTLPPQQPQPWPATTAAARRCVDTRWRTAAAAAADGERAAAAAPTTAGSNDEALLFDFSRRLVDYETAWAWQRRRVDALCGAAAAAEAAGAAAAGAGAAAAPAGAIDARDSVILLQHPPTFTLGAGSTLAHLGFDPDSPPHPLHRTERGGEVTYHGPGQLVMYPVLDLSRAPHSRDLHWYLRSLEEVVIRAASSASGIEAGRVEGLTGVWAGGAKLAAIGVRARKWVTFHGLALNVVNDLGPFGLVVPCGIADKAVGSVASALGRASEVRAGAGRAASGRAACGAWGAEERQLLLEYRYALLEAFEEVFGLRLVPASAAQAAALLGADAGALMAAAAEEEEEGGDAEEEEEAAALEAEAAAVGG